MNNGHGLPAPDAPLVLGFGDLGGPVDPVGNGPGPGLASASWFVGDAGSPGLTGASNLADAGEATHTARPITVSFLSHPGKPDGGDGSSGVGALPPSLDAGSPGLASLIEDFGGGANAGDPGPASADSFAAGGGGNGHKPGGGGTGGTVPTTYTVSNANSSLNFVINWDTSVGSAPAAFSQTIESAVNSFTSLGGPTHANAITLTFNVGWGEVLGSRLSFGALGKSETYLDQTTYTALSSKLSSLTVSVASDPGGTLWVPTAEEKALGLGTISANGSNLDGGVGFSSSVGWTYNNASSVAAGTYDLYSVAQHEISETMGRIGLNGGTIGSTPNSYSAFDLFRYSGVGQGSPGSGGTAYFSYDGGYSSGALNNANSSITNFNSISGGDLSDWAGSAGNDAYNAFANSGAKYSSSIVDTRVMDALGYGATPASPYKL